VGLSVRNIGLAYGSEPVLSGVSFEAEAGEVVGVVGPNASGKTTLLRGLSGTLRPRGGSVTLDGAPITDLTARERARVLAVVPQSQPTEWAFTVREMVEMGRTPYMGGVGRATPADREAVEAAMARAGILPLADKDSTTLSSGQAQLVVLARAMAQEPRLLLLDEPTAHLDITHQLEVMETVRTIVRDRSLTAVAVLHDLNLAARYCERVLVLSHGRARGFGRPEEVLTRASIQATFGVEVLVRRHPTTGATYVVPLAVAGPARVGAAPGHRVHVVCGGGSGQELLPALVRAGHEVSVGVVNVLDTDFDAAEGLGLRIVAEAPFSPVTPRSFEEARGLAVASDAVVVAPLPVGPANLAALETARAALEAGRRVVVVTRPPISERDYTAGRASQAVEALLAGGATPAANTSDVLRQLGPAGE
jgi:iron complex transport system ATP-binding protein